MRAFQVIVHGAPSSLRCNEIPDVAPGDCQIRIGVRAAGINFSDVLAVSSKNQGLHKRPRFGDHNDAVPRYLPDSL